MSHFRRPPFDVAGSVVARRELKMSERTYSGGEELSAADRATLTERQLAVFWEQGLIDTLPPAPAPPAAKHQQYRR